MEKKAAYASRTSQVAHLKASRCDRKLKYFLASNTVAYPEQR